MIWKGNQIMAWFNPDGPRPQDCIGASARCLGWLHILHDDSENSPSKPAAEYVINDMPAKYFIFSIGKQERKQDGAVDITEKVKKKVEALPPCRIRVFESFYGNESQLQVTIEKIQATIALL